MVGWENRSENVPSDGGVWMWGYLGVGGQRNRNLAARVPGLDHVKAVAGGYAHSLALKDDGTVWARGWNKDRQLGDGTAEDRAQPVKVQAIDNVAAVTAGHQFSAALRKDGTVWVWGSNAHRQLGTVRGPYYWIRSPMQVEGIPPIVALDAGSFHIIALDKEGGLWEWGHNWLQPKKIRMDN